MNYFEHIEENNGCCLICKCPSLKKSERVKIEFYVCEHCGAIYTKYAYKHTVSNPNSKKQVNWVV